MILEIFLAASEINCPDKKFAFPLALDSNKNTRKYVGFKRHKVSTRDWALLVGK